MKFKKIYTLGLGLLIAGMSAVNAQTQDNEKIFYRMDRVKANNPWTKSLNYAGLTFNENQDFTIVELDFQYGKGSFRNVNAPHAFNKTNLQTESFRRLNKGEFYQFNLSSCIRQQNSLTAQFVSFSLSNLANIF